ncbi:MULTISPECIES: hypothetical protein [Micromonospora]|uniref:hypothetical protein n=1 Tax=Micromonospora TaxID=1873 RepID=UPI0031D05A0A
MALKPIAGFDQVDPRSLKPTHPGWLWLTAYVLDGQGHAVAKREIHLRLAGLRLVRRTPPPRLGLAGASLRVNLGCQAPAT